MAGAKRIRQCTSIVRGKSKAVSTFNDDMTMQTFQRYAAAPHAASKALPNVQKRATFYL